MYVPRKFGSMLSLPRVMAHEQRISLVLMVLGKIRYRDNGHIGPHQVTYETVAMLVQSEYVCAAQVCCYAIVTASNGS